MKDKKLVTESIPNLIKMIAIPSSIGFFFNTMYNITDTFFAGMLSTLAQSALALSFPVFFIIIALGSGTSSGATALIGNELGAGNFDKAKKYARQTITFSAFLGIFITILGITISPFLFKFLGAEGDYLNLALQYMNVMYFGAAFFTLTFAINGVLNAVGDTKSFRNFLIVGFFANVILSPAFMFGWSILPTMGIAGIALATVLIELYGFIYLMYKFMKTDLAEKCLFRKIRPDLSIYKDIAKQGLPASFGMMTIAVGVFVITYFIGQFGEEAVAAYGIATRIEQVALLPMIGLNVAALTLVSQNRGAKLFERVRETIKITMKYGLIIMVPGAILVSLFAPFWMGIFSDNLEVIRIGASYLRIAAWAFFAFVILFTYDSVFRGFKKPNIPMIIGFLRQIIIPVPLFYIIVFKTDLGLYGLWWSIFATVWVFAIVQWLFSKKVLNYAKRD